MEELLRRYPQLAACEADITLAYELIRSTYLSGKKVLLCGNGGSASDALHIVGELMKGFVKPRKVGTDRLQSPKLDAETSHYLASNLQGGLPAIALMGEDALFTAYLNDVAPDMVFAQQVWGYGEEGDLLIGITTSGNSGNVIRAAQTALAKNMKVVGLTGAGGGKLKELADACICVPETETFKVQELHLPVYHALCLMIEECFF